MLVFNRCCNVYECVQICIHKLCPSPTIMACFCLNLIKNYFNPDIIIMLHPDIYYMEHETLMSPEKYA